MILMVVSIPSDNFYKMLPCESEFRGTSCGSPINHSDVGYVTLDRRAEDVSLAIACVHDIDLGCHVVFFYISVVSYSTGTET